MGGKRNLADRIVGRLRSIPHTAYVEPFIGMGGIFLRRTWRARGEVINDINREVATLFRVLQRHFVPLMDMLRWQLTSRVEFERLKAARPDTLTDLERAARLLYLQRTAFGGKVTGQNFGTTPGQPGRFDVAKLGPVLEAVHERLSGVTIECLPWEDLLPRYDGAETLFYLDPPYWGCETDYGDGIFAPADFERLAAALGNLHGPWLLSLNDVPQVRAIFAAFPMDSVPTTYTVSNAGSARVSELLITSPGFDARGSPLFG